MLRVIANRLLLRNRLREEAGETLLFTWQDHMGESLALIGNKGGI